MKRDKNELFRLQNLIEDERINTCDNFINIVSLDINKLLKDYFEFKKTPNVCIEKNGGKLNLLINLEVERIKNFSNASK